MMGGIGCKLLRRGLLGFEEFWDFGFAREGAGRVGEEIC